jgi:FlaA1/EpsC-like NDP-sugar epimerase
MTIPEAAQLVIQAGGLPASAAVYVLDMGDPVRIVDLAHDFIRLAGLEPGIDVPIRFTGARPGEKLYEELLTDKEASSKTDHESIFVAPNADSISDNFEALLATLIDSAEQAQGADIRAGLQQLVSTYHPTKQLAANAATSSRSVQRAR